MGWQEFLVKIDKNPRQFAKAIIEELDPPKYAIQRLRHYEWLCGWPGCWTVRTDICFNCHTSVCDEHSEKIIGPKTELEWYVCQACQNTVPRDELLQKIHAEDEQFWLEDQEALQSSSDSTPTTKREVEI